MRVLFDLRLVVGEQTSRTPRDALPLGDPSSPKSRLPNFEIGNSHSKFSFEIPIGEYKFGIRDSCCKSGFGSGGIP